MTGQNFLKTLTPRPGWVRKKLGYPALLLGAVLAKIKVNGRWHLPKKGPCIIAANHFSYIDPPFFKYAVQRPISFLAASDQEIEWFYMWAPLLYGFIPTDRKNLAPSTIKMAKTALRRGEILGIFPEGASTSPSLRFPKNGAVFLSTLEKVPIVPMAIYGAETAWEDFFLGIRPRVHINIGKPFGPFDITGTKEKRTKKMADVGYEMISRIAALLPEEKQGICKGEKRIATYQKENGFFPANARLSSRYGSLE